MKPEPMYPRLSFFSPLLKKSAAVFVCSALFTSAYASTFPSYFDGRRENPDDRTSAFTTKIVTPVLDQGQTSTCWTFGTLSAFESSWNKKLSDAGITSSPFVDPESGYVRFSERYLVWMGKSDPLPPSRITPELIDYIYISLGGDEYKAASAMLAGGLVWEASSPFPEYARGISEKIPPVGILHDVFTAPELSVIDLIRTNPDKIKRFISEYGAVSAAYGSDPIYSSGADIYTSAVFSETNELLYFINHQVALVGWDDDYDFSSSGLSEKPSGKGAWIMKNSWGTEYGDKGYYYVSYEDTSLVFSGAFIPEMDLRRYTLTDTYARFSDNRNWYVDTPSLSGGNTYRASAHQFVKAVGFYADHDRMNYTLEIRTRTDTPDGGRVVHVQSGSFGADGSPEWAGYRTIDLDSLVFIPQGEDYFVTITLSNETGTGILRHYASDAAPGTELKSFVYEQGEWITMPEGYVLSFYVQGKHTDLAAGENFTVASLDDGGAGGAVINLGKAGEKYGYDLLHPDRETLSTMTVDLTAGKTDSVFGGTIIGEGGLIKAGTGTLELRGPNTYTGTTEVRSGTLYVNGGTSFSPALIQAAGRMEAAGNAVFYKDISNLGTLDISGGASFSAVSGTGGISKSGTGTASFTGPSSAGSYTVRAQGGNGTTELSSVLSTDRFVMETDHTLRSVIRGTGSGEYGQIFITDAGTVRLNGHTLDVAFSFPSALLDKGQAFTAEILNMSPAGGSLTWADTRRHNNMYSFTPVSDTSLEIRRTASESDVALRGGASAAEWAAAGVWAASGYKNSVSDVLDKMAAYASPAAYRLALASVMPDSYDGARKQAQSGTAHLFNALNIRQEGLSGMTGRSGGETAETGVWGKYLYNRTDAHGGFTGRTNGFVLGADTRLSDERTVVGGGYSFAATSARSEGRRTDMDAHSVFGYAQKTDGPEAYGLSATYTHLKADETKMLSKDRYSLEQAAVQATAGYALPAFVPTAKLRYVYTYEHGRTDTAGQKIKSSGSHLLTILAGGRLTRRISDISLNASAYAAYDAVSEKNRTDVFLPDGTGYAVEGERLRRFGAEISAGLSYAVNGRTDLSLDYGGQFRRGFRSHTGMLRLRYVF